MLRLLPEVVYGGLFTGASWLDAGRGRIAINGPASIEGAADLLTDLAAMLSQLPQAGGRQRRLHLIVSDAIAAVTVLPWQDRLTGKAELDAYARACFERIGRDIDEQWVMQTGFRQYGGGGMAYALGEKWMRELLAVCEKFQVRLETVLPVSAAAYWRTARTRAGATTLLVLSEPLRITGLLYDAGRLALADIQPVIGDEEASGRRLLLRISAGHPDIRSVRYWTTARDPLTVMPEYIRACLDQVPVSPLPRNEWN